MRLDSSAGRLLAATLGLALAGCSGASFAVGGEDASSTSSDGATAGASDGATGDDATAASDATSDGGTSVPITVPDGSSDEAAVSTDFCGILRAPAFFCDQFDDATRDIPPMFTGSDILDGGVVSPDDALSVSPPRSMRSRLSASVPEGAATVFEVRKLSGPFAPVWIETQVRWGASCLPSGSSGAGVTLLAFAAQPPGATKATYSITLAESDGATLVVESNGTSTRNYVLPGFPAETFHRVGVFIDEIHASLAMQIDDQPSTSTPLGLLPSASLGTVTVSLGQVRATPSTVDCAVWYDNFVWYQ